MEQMEEEEKTRDPEDGVTTTTPAPIVTPPVRPPNVSKMGRVRLDHVRAPRITRSR